MAVPQTRLVDLQSFMLRVANGWCDLTEAQRQARGLLHFTDSLLPDMGLDIRKGWLCERAEVPVFQIQGRYFYPSSTSRDRFSIVGHETKYQALLAILQHELRDGAPLNVHRWSVSPESFRKNWRDRWIRTFEEKALRAHAEIARQITAQKDGTILCRIDGTFSCN